MNKTKINFLKETNNYNYYPDKVQDELFRKYNFFDPYDKAQVKYEMLREYCIDNISVTNICQKFGFSRETFYTLYRNFKKHGIQTFINEQKGRKTRIKITLEISGYIIATKASEPHLSGAQLAKRIKEKFKVTVSKKTVERELKKFGMLFKKRKYYFK